MTRRTDIPGAGFVLYEMATGQRPFAEVQSAQLIVADDLHSLAYTAYYQVSSLFVSERQQ